MELAPVCQNDKSWSICWLNYVKIYVWMNDGSWKRLGTERNGTARGWIWAIRKICEILLKVYLWDRASLDKGLIAVHFFWAFDWYPLAWNFPNSWVSISDNNIRFGTLRSRIELDIDFFRSWWVWVHRATLDSGPERQAGILCCRFT